jgi:tetratricopeptide (TPR) repeat protein
MRQGLWILLVIVIIAAGLGLTLQRDRTDHTDAIAGIEAMTDPVARARAGIAYILDHPELEQEPLWRALGAALDSAVEANGEERAIALGESLATLDLPTAQRQEVLSYLQFRYMQSDGPGALARGEGLLRELLAAGDVSPETLALSTWLQATHSESDKRLALEAAFRTYRTAKDDGSLQYVLYPVDLGLRSFVEGVASRRGLDAGLAAADSLFASADDDMLRGLALAQTYRLAVDDAPDRAASATAAISELDGFEAPDILNEIAYDMAERRFEPDTALALSERALALASSRSDSVNILDTAGWAAHAAGRRDLAVEYLEKSVVMTNETLSLSVVQVDHLLQAYSEAGSTDEAIELLAKVVARSPADDDPARALLEQRLVERDGTAAGLDAMIGSLRYDGVEDAPLFALPDRAGETVALEDLRGDVVVVAFWGYG